MTGDSAGGTGSGAQLQCVQEYCIKTQYFMETTMQYAYTVTLHHPSLPRALCQEAEVQYRQTLESALGGIEGVMKTWRAWQDAEHTLGSLSEETWRVARQWLIAADDAHHVALQDIAGASDAYFEVQQVRADSAASSSL